MSVCVCVFVCVRVFVCTYMHVYIHVYLFVYVRLHTLHACMYEFTCLSKEQEKVVTKDVICIMCTCTWKFMCICECICVCTCKYFWSSFWDHTWYDTNTTQKVTWIIIISKCYKIVFTAKHLCFVIILNLKMDTPGSIGRVCRKWRWWI